MTVKSFFPPMHFLHFKNREDYLEKLSFSFVLFWNGCFQPVFYSHGQKGWNSNSSDFSAIIPSPFLAMTVHITIEEYYKQSLNFLWLQNPSNIAAIRAIFLRMFHFTVAEKQISLVWTWRNGIWINSCP